MPKAGGFKHSPAREQRHDPLHLELARDEDIARYGKIVNGKLGRKDSKKKKKKKHSDESETDEDVRDRFLDVKTSKRVLDLAQAQQEEEMVRSDDSSDEGPTQKKQRRKRKPKPAALVEDEMPDDDENEAGPSIANAIRSQPTFDSDDDSLDEDEAKDAFLDEEYAEELQIDAGDMQALDAFLPSSTGERKTLADLIFEKFESGEIEAGKKVNVKVDDGPPDPTAGLDPKVVAVYEKVGELMNRYRSGPLPKPFKILPAIPSWARLLAITNPRMWTPHAFNAATRILIASLKPEQARVYLEVVLMEAIRENLQANNGKLNVQLYEALRRSTYKPAAFFKGMLFPLVENGCTLKEASVFASVLQKTSIPILHSAAALLRLASMDYSGPVSLFVRVLLDKKYALPYKVVDGMVFHFIRIANTYKASRATGEHLPVLWHQSLLVFVQRYGSDLTPEQKDALLDVVKARFHPQIGPEVRRHIVNSVMRGEPRPVADGDIEMA